MISMKHSAARRHDRSEPTDFIRTTVRRREFITGGLAVGGLVLAGCSSSATSGSGTSSSGLSLISLTDVIARGFDRDGPNTDPGFAEANYNTFDGLVAYPQPLIDGAFVPNFSADIDQFVPLLAESWIQQSPKVWIVKLRQGVKSAVGNELTSADVVYTFARAKSVSGSAPNSWFLANVGGILTDAPVVPNAPASAKMLTNEVVAVDKYTVQFNLFQDTGRLFMVALADTNLTIFDSVEMKKHATASDPWSHTWGNQNCAGFGPYTITTYKPGTQIVYQARPNYYRAAPKYTRVITSAVAEAGSRVAALKIGQAQIAEYLDPADLASLKSDNSVSLIGSYTNDIAFICLNYSYPPWNLPTNKLLRQAVAYSIPYEDIVKLDYLGFARRMYSQVPSTFDGYVAHMTYQTDLTKAKSLLAQAGFPGGNGPGPLQLRAAVLLRGRACLTARACGQPDQDQPRVHRREHHPSAAAPVGVRDQAAADRRHADVALRFLLAVGPGRDLSLPSCCTRPLRRAAWSIPRTTRTRRSTPCRRRRRPRRAPR